MSLVRVSYFRFRPSAYRKGFLIAQLVARPVNRHWTKWQLLTNWLTGQGRREHAMEEISDCSRADTAFLRLLEKASGTLYFRLQ